MKSTVTTIIVLVLVCLMVSRFREPQLTLPSRYKPGPPMRCDVWVWSGDLHEAIAAFHSLDEKGGIICIGIRPPWAITWSIDPFTGEAVKTKEWKQ